MVSHRPMAYEFGRPMPGVELSMLHANCAAAVRREVS